MTALGYGHRENTRPNRKEENEEPSCRSLVAGHQKRHGHALADSERKSGTSLTSNNYVCTDILGGISAHDSLETLPITFAAMDTMPSLTRLFQQETKHSKTENSSQKSQKQAQTFCQDRAQNNWQLPTAAHSSGAQQHSRQESQCSVIPHLGTDDLEVRCFQADHFEVHPGDTQSDTMRQNQLYHTGQQNQNYGNFSTSMSNTIGGLTMAEKNPPFWGQNDLGIFMQCSSVAGDTTRDGIFQLLNSMRLSLESQQAIHDWDSSMGLKRNHSKTTGATSRSRTNLQDSLELVKKPNNTKQKCHGSHLFCGCCIS